MSQRSQRNTASPLSGSPYSSGRFPAPAISCELSDHLRPEEFDVGDDHRPGGSGDHQPSIFVGTSIVHSGHGGRSPRETTLGRTGAHPHPQMASFSGSQFTSARAVATIVGVESPPIDATVPSAAAMRSRSPVDSQHQHQHQLHAARSPSQSSLQDGSPFCVHSIGPSGDGTSFVPFSTSHAGSGMLSTMTPLAEEEESAIVKQVEFNARMMKLKLFSLLKMSVTREEERELERELVDMEQQLSPAAGSVDADLSTAVDTGSGQFDKTTTSVDPGALLGASTSDNGRTAAGESDPRSKQMQRIRSTLDSFFRFTFEEVALRWHALQSRPFSLKVYHEVVKAEILKRERAEHRSLVSTKLIEKLQEELHQTSTTLEQHKEAHGVSIRQFYQELLILRNRVDDLQRRLGHQQGGSHAESIPELLECDERANELADREAMRRKEQEEEKHASYMYKRASEELALLRHTLAERTSFIKALENEVNTSRADTRSTKSQLRQYLDEHEAMDAEFEQLVQQNEKQMHQLQSENEALLADIANRDSRIAALEARVQRRPADLDATVSDAAASRSARESVAEDETSEPAPRHLNSTAAFPSKRSFGRGSRVREDAVELSGSGPGGITPGRVGSSNQDSQRADKRGGAASRAAGLRGAGSAAGSKGSRSVGKGAATAGGNAAVQEELSRLSGELRAAAQKTTALEKEVEAAQKQKLALHRDCAATLETANAAKKEAAALKEKCAAAEEEAKRKLESLELERRSERAFLKKKSLDLGERVTVLERQLKEANRKLLLSQGELLEDVMNLHRQMSIAEDFMSAHLEVDKLEALRRRLEKDDDDPNEAHGVHTPRTLHYFTMASQLRRLRSGESSRVSDCARGTANQSSLSPTTADTSAKQELLLLPISTATAVVSEGDFRGEDAPSAPVVMSVGGPRNESQRSIFTKSKVSLHFVKHVSEMKLQHEREQLLAEQQKSTGQITGSESSVTVDSKVIRSPRSRITPPACEQEVATLKMVIEDLLSQHGAAKIVHTKLRADFASFVSYHNKVIQDMRDREANKSPAALVALTRLQGNEQQQQQQHYRAPGHPSTQNAEEVSPTKRLAECSSDASCLDVARSSTCAAAKQGVFNVVDDFPGVEHATEFLDLLEAFGLLRTHLIRLVDLCVADAHRGALEPDDLHRIRVILNEKYMAFRAIETHASAIVTRLHKKREDIMRRREEELELVLQSTQNISLTHPREAQKLLRVVKHAQQERAGGLCAGDDGIRDFAVEVQRPSTAMSIGVHASQRRTVESPDVVVAGAPALMAMRKRVTSASAQWRKR